MSYGNQTADFNKGIAWIRYNSLNLPEKVQFSNGNTSEYLYDASGVKRRATYKTALPNVYIPFGDLSKENLASNVSTTTRTDYDGNYIYENGALSKVLTPEGYIAGGSYHYFEKDHLGNTRVVLKAGSTVQVAQVTDYYPFGMEISDPNRIQPTFSGSPNPYLYNGKEMDRMHGLNMLDYGARWYDAALGRWGGVIDPLAEKYYWISPYAYCANNPIRFVDLKGEEPTVYEAALMAKHVYGDKVDLVGGWSQTKTYNNSNSGLQSALYQRTTDGVTEYAYVSAGTQMTDWGDIKEDVGQVFGSVNQYKESVKTAEKLANVDLKGSELTFVGHSLGGGLAAADALKTGKNAITFNPAALSDATKDALGLPDKGKGSIFNVVVKGEALDNFQSKMGLKLEGGKYELKASYFGTESMINIERLMNHSIDVVIKKLEEENKK